MLRNSITESDTLIARIDAILPQTQCTKCGFSGCKPYAIAIVNGQADINQCPPGGDAGIRALANLTHIEYKPLNFENGLEKPKTLAFIDEATCIGCTLCIQACPIDAILGASKQMHTVIANECTGCELCLAPCPVDCISMQPVENMSQHFNNNVNAAEKSKTAADLARRRYDFRLSRLAREETELLQKYSQRKDELLKKNLNNMANLPENNNALIIENIKQSAVAAAIERAKSLKVSAKTK
ncbi:MAG: electron transport complex subunit RsxB [Pseudomonadota bacterium]